MQRLDVNTVNHLRRQIQMVVTLDGLDRLPSLLARTYDGPLVLLEEVEGYLDTQRAILERNEPR
jgi:hypothetical protein